MDGLYLINVCEKKNLRGQKDEQLKSAFSFYLVFEFWLLK